MTAPSREMLEAWIAQSQRTRHRLMFGLVPAFVIATGVLVWSRPAGALALTCVGLVALFGMWITSSHINEWEAKIDALDRPKQSPLRPDGRLRRERD